MIIETNSSTALIVEEKPLCAGAISTCLRFAFDVAHARIEKSITRDLVAKSKGNYVVVIVDLATINHDFDTLAMLTSHLRLTPVIALDDRPNPAFSCISETIGCRGYLAKTYDEELIVTAVRSVMNGQSWFQVSSDLHESAHCNRPTRPRMTLTERQHTVLGCLSRGLSNEEIALQLGISLGTAKTHVHTILNRIGARNRTEAAIIAPRFYLHNRANSP